MSCVLQSFLHRMPPTKRKSGDGAGKAAKKLAIGDGTPDAKCESAHAGIFAGWLHFDFNI